MDLMADPWSLRELSLVPEDHTTSEPESNIPIATQLLVRSTKLTKALEEAKSANFVRKNNRLFALLS
jgi:hypothetical protein